MSGVNSYLQKITGFAEAIARDAGAILLRGFRSDRMSVSYKSASNLVTNIDRESEDFLYQAIGAAYPDHSIVAEEGSRRDTGGEFVWYVDPLDATNNFAHGLPFFCVSIGVYSTRENRVVAGVVFDPVHNELFSASRSGGAFLNGAPIAVTKNGDLNVAFLATGFPYERKNPEKNNLVQFTSLSPNVQGIRRLGSAALDLSYVACGRFDGYWEPELHPWDMAAGSLIVEEAGGKVSKYNGDPFEPEYPEILASNGLIHGAMGDILLKSRRRT